jgi:hypothetical protein
LVVEQQILTAMSGEQGTRYDKSTTWWLILVEDARRAIRMKLLAHLSAAIRPSPSSSGSVTGTFLTSGSRGRGVRVAATWTAALQRVASVAQPPLAEKCMKSFSEW